MNQPGAKIPTMYEFGEALELIRLISRASNKPVSLTYSIKANRWKCTSAPAIGYGQTPLEAINSFAKQYRLEVFNSLEKTTPQ